MFDNGENVTTGWLVEYRKLYKRRRALERKAQQIKMRRSRKRRARAALDLRNTPFYLSHCYELDPATSRSVTRAVEADKVSGTPKLPARPEYWRFDTRRDAVDFANQRHEYVLDLYSENGGLDGTTLRSIRLVTPGDAVRLFDDEAQRPHWVVLYRAVRGKSVWLPRWGRSRVDMPPSDRSSSRFRNLGLDQGGQERWPSRDTRRSRS